MDEDERKIGVAVVVRRLGIDGEWQLFALDG